MGIQLSFGGGIKTNSNTVGMCGKSHEEQKAKELRELVLFIAAPS